MKFQRSKIDLLLHLVAMFGLCLVVVGAQKKHFGRKLNGRIINSLETKSVESCYDECDRRQSCVSINYYRLKKICELNLDTISENDELVLEVAPGYVFQERMKSVENKCREICPQGWVCGKNNRCRVEECWKLHVTNGLTYGNMKNIGSKVEVKCFKGYEKDHDFRTVQCGADGKWDINVDVFCKKQCDVPPQISSGNWIEAVLETPQGRRVYNVNDVTLSTDVEDIYDVIVLEGSSVTYACEENLQMYGEQTVHCAGEIYPYWRKPPVCFYPYCRKEKEWPCKDPKMVCSDDACHCESDVNQYTMKLCVETCPEMYTKTTPATDDTSKQTTGNNIDEPMTFSSVTTSANSQTTASKAEETIHKANETSKQPTENKTDEQIIVTSVTTQANTETPDEMTKTDQQNNITLVTTLTPTNTTEKTTVHKTDEHITEKLIPLVPEEKCRTICHRAKDFACRRFRPWPVVASSNATCMIWSVHFADIEEEIYWRVENECPKEILDGRFESFYDNSNDLY